MAITCASKGSSLKPVKKFCWIIVRFSYKILVLMKLSQNYVLERKVNDELFFKKGD